MTCDGASGRELYSISNPGGGRALDCAGRLLRARDASGSHPRRHVRANCSRVRSAGCPFVAHRDTALAYSNGPTYPAAHVDDCASSARCRADEARAHNGSYGGTHQHGTTRDPNGATDRFGYSTHRLGRRSSKPTLRTFYNCLRQAGVHKAGDRGRTSFHGKRADE